MVHVLDFGSILAVGTPAEIQENQRGPRRLPRHERRRMTALLELKDVRASYGRIEVLHGVDLAVPEGSVVALLGPQRRRQDHDPQGGVRAASG